MKFLGWMHRKFMENGTEPMKNSQTGNPSTCLSVHTMFDEQNCYVKPTKTLSDSNIKRQKSSNRMEANNMEVLVQEESYEPFDFLAIGTFGMDLLNTDPPTPKLPMPSKESTNQQAEITENDLKLINYELQKFLGAEEEENGNDTSERGSTASIVTLSNMISEKADSEDHMCMMACPLQNYLFATTVEMVEKDKEVEKERTPLDELFKRNNIVYDDPKRKYEVAEQRSRKTAIAHLMKKVVKKFHLSLSSSMASSENNDAVSLPIKKKLSKALKKFQRKIHPDQMNEKQLVKLQKGERKYISQKDASQIGGHNENNMAGRFGRRKSENNTPNLSSSGISKGATTIKGEHWIKTDSDYLVLEL